MRSRASAGGAAVLYCPDAFGHRTPCRDWLLASAPLAVLWRGTAGTVAGGRRGAMA
jgi:hypothetical protein